MLRQALNKIHSECVEYLNKQLGTSRLMADMVCEWAIDLGLVLALSIIITGETQLPRIEDRGELFEEQSNYWGE